MVGDVFGKLLIKVMNFSSLTLLSFLLHLAVSDPGICVIIKRAFVHFAVLGVELRGVFLSLGHETIREGPCIVNLVTTLFIYNHSKGHLFN